jgi:hypothetical protein
MGWQLAHMRGKPEDKDDPIVSRARTLWEEHCTKHRSVLVGMDPIPFNLTRVHEGILTFHDPGSNRFCALFIHEPILMPASRMAFTDQEWVWFTRMMLKVKVDTTILTYPYQIARSSFTNQDRFHIYLDLQQIRGLGHSPQYAVFALGEYDIDDFQGYICWVGIEKAQENPFIEESREFTSFAIYAESSQQLHECTRRFYSVAEQYYDVDIENWLEICHECRQYSIITGLTASYPLPCSICYQAAVAVRKPMKHSIQRSGNLQSTTLLLGGRQLRRVLYKIYRGRCQYCPGATPIPFEDTVIEHIIPKNIPLEEIYARLIAMNITPSVAESFCSSLLPALHDCVLNYTLACRWHNSQKQARFLHPAALESLLKNAKGKAQAVLRAYQQITQRPEDLL